MSRVFNLVNNYPDEFVHIRYICQNYYSFKIFPLFLLAKSTRLIHHNQLLMTKFGRNLTLTRK